jgi:hypothetical protein
VNAGEAFGYTADQIDDKTSILWIDIKDVFAFYTQASCPCAFPRFQQIASFDGVTGGGSCYCSETEAFIQFARDSYIRTILNDHGEVRRERWQCLTCSSTFIYAWSDFSIHVSRSCLNAETILVAPVGAPAEREMFVHLGVFGHSYPPELRGSIRVVQLGDFITHVRALRPHPHMK